MQNNPPAAPVPAAHVLVVDDDPTVAEVVAGYLDRAGHDVVRAADGPSALAHFAHRRPDLVVLDLMLPGMDGFEICRRMREQGGPVPVIMLTARGDEEDRVLGLETGADDYVTKPFSPRELVLRVESVLRRARLPFPTPPGPPGSSPAANVLRTSTLTLDPTARRATREGAELALTLREFDLLAFFLRNPGRAFTREELMSEVWGWDFGDLSTVTVHVRRLRAKIEHDPARPRLIQTVWGVGYRLAGEDGGAASAAPVAPGALAGPAGVRGVRDAGAGDGGPDAPRAHGMPAVSAAPVGLGDTAEVVAPAGLVRPAVGPAGAVESTTPAGPAAPAGASGHAGTAGRAAPGGPVETAAPATGPRPAPPVGPTPSTLPEGPHHP